MNDLLIVGKTPPPIGGVTIHTQRLIQLLNNQIDFCFYNMHKFQILSFIKAVKESRVAHIHASNPFFLLFCSIVCILLRKKSIITIHANIGRHNVFGSLAEILAIILCNIPVVLNKNSFYLAKRFNPNAIIFSSFIAPIELQSLSSDVQRKIIELKKRVHTVFCTNAYDRVFDKYNNEIYGIASLLQIFNSYNELGLIVSDPQGAYFRYVSSENIVINENIIFISRPHSFFEVLRFSDCYIRNTSTDGDSISIKEALYLGVKVIATNCVDRPEGVELCEANNSRSLDLAVQKTISQQASYHKPNPPIDGGVQLVKLYNELLAKSA